jgi:hypothetical protein
VTSAVLASVIFNQTLLDCLFGRVVLSYPSET